MRTIYIRKMDILIMSECCGIVKMYYPYIFVR